MRAEARGADERAVAAGEAALGDDVPVRALEVAREQGVDAVGLEAAGHLAGGAGDDLRAPRDVAGGCRARRQLGEHGLAGGRAGADEEAVVAVEELGQGEVEAVGRSGPAAQRGAEAEVRGVAAVDGDDEHVGAPRGVVGVLEAAAEEHAVLDRDRRDLARLHAEKRRRLRRRRLLLDRESAVAAARLPEAHARGQELALPRVRPDRVAEDGVVVAPREPVGAGRLLVRPAGGEVGGAGRARRGRSSRHVRLGRRCDSRVPGAPETANRGRRRATPRPRLQSASPFAPFASKVRSRRPGRHR